MNILLRKTTLDNGAVTAQIDAEVTGSSISIGSDHDLSVPLYGELIQALHCTLTAKAGGSFRLECSDSATVVVDGKPIASTTLNPGSSFNLGTHRIFIMSAPPGFDAALEVEIDADAAGSSRLRYANAIRTPLPPLRKLAWVGALVVLVCGLLLPLLSFVQPDTGDALDKAGLPSDHFWLSGPLAGAHQLSGIGDDCGSCHVKAFEMVTDQTCVGCHDNTPAHYPADHPDWANEPMRCAGCHKEHNEPGNLVIGHDGVCTDCHVDIQHRSDIGSDVSAVRSEIAPAKAFSEGLHPEFLLTMLNPRDGKWLRERRQTVADKPQEQSNLKFPHDLHMDAEKVSKPDSVDALSCDSCHSLQKNGEHFEPITMEATCKGCHSLAFDPNEPDREMPHAEPAAVYTQLQEYFTSRAADAEQGIRIQRQLRRAPGKKQTVDADNSEPCVGSVRDCGLKIAAEEMERLFMHTGCVTCHEVTGSGDRWQVEKVRLNDDWYSGSTFNHKPHLNAALGDKDSQCLDCHAADKSDDSAHILIPGVENCLQCHDTEHKNSSKLLCLDCHGFHDSDHSVMVPAIFKTKQGDMK